MDQNNLPAVLRELIAESASGCALIESNVLAGLELTPDEAQVAVARITAQRDNTSYHLLFALRRSAPDVYRGTLETTRAEILCAAMAHLTYLNDWGYLAPGGSYDGEAARALLETTAAALKYLHALLDDARPAPLFGSEEATMSSLYRYRRCDFAARYLALILGADSTFAPTPEERDFGIARLKAYPPSTMVYSRANKRTPSP